MSELPLLTSLFKSPPEQKIEPGQPNNYVGVYCVGSHITVVTRQPSTFSFPRVEVWRPFFDCALPSDVQAADTGYFVLWFTGMPSQRGRHGACVREVCVTSISRAEQGRELTQEEYIKLRHIA